MTSTAVASRRWRVRASAKINLTLRVLGIRADGYHELRTTFQSLAVHDTLTVERLRGPFAISSDDPRCPTDASNLVWKAAAALWKASGKRGEVSGVRVHIRKRIPMEAGLGGGSSDAAATLLALRAIWRSRLTDLDLADIGRTLGADVPFFLDGGTALGVERGDLLFPLVDAPPAWVVIARPNFGVSTKDAYGWWDEAFLAAGGAAVSVPAAGRTPVRPVGRQLGQNRSGQARLGRVAQSRAIRSTDSGNDLQAPVCLRHPEILSLINKLQRSGARMAAMSGSGSAVFGLFDQRAAARSAGAVLARRPDVAVWVTRTTTRRQHLRASAPQSIG
ncbi:MAG: 4-(cytidine 5'-diphospho)-2-C-methyl-D-erythritol kinase [Vicinamibacterales bacterium]